MQFTFPLGLSRLPDVLLLHHLVLVMSFLPYMMVASSFTSGSSEAGLQRRSICVQAAPDGLELRV